MVLHCAFFFGKEVYINEGRILSTGQQFRLCYPDLFLQGFECVAYYECGADGTIITDGAGLIGDAN